MTRFQKVVMTNLVLMICVGGSVWINHGISREVSRSNEITLNSESSDGRAIASVKRQQVVRSITLDSQSKLAVDLATPKQRDLASLGRRANPVEEMRFGVLEGKYALELEGNKVSEISFVDNPNSDGRPKMISNRSEFLKKYSDVLGIGEKSERLSIDARGSKIIETYKVIAKDSGAEMTVSFTLDESDRVYAIKSQSTKIQPTL